MGLPRSTFYDVPTIRLGDAEIVSRMQAICDELEAYGYRRGGPTSSSRAPASHLPTQMRTG